MVEIGHVKQGSPEPANIEADVRDTEPNGIIPSLLCLMPSRHSTTQAAFPITAAASPPARRPSAPPYSSTSTKTVDATMPTEQANTYALPGLSRMNQADTGSYFPTTNSNRIAWT